MKRAFTLVVIVTVAWSVGPASAQQVDEQAQTQERLNALRQQIEQFEERLSQTAESEQASLERLESVSRQVKIREELLRGYRQRLAQLETERDSIRRSMAGLEAAVEELRTEYQQRARHAYMFGRLHDLALIFSARSINQMLVRIQYLHRFTEQRKSKLMDLQKTVSSLRERRQELISTEEQTETLIAETRSEQQDLIRLRENRRQMISQLRAQQVELKEEIEEKRSTASELERRIRRMVAAASRRSAGSRNDAAFAALSGSFRENRGGLPWPSVGAVTEPYGEVVHPVYGTTTTNPGILISTTPSAEVRTVFRGEVLGVDVMPEFGTYVVVQHGKYQTVYSNLSLVYAEEGDVLGAGETIGRAGTEAAAKGAGVFFAIFEEGQQMNPLAWLRDR